MPLPDERPRQSVANLIGRFEQQGKRQPPSAVPVVPRSSSVSSQIAGDTTKEEVKEKREWPPKPVTSADIKPAAPTLSGSPSTSMSKSAVATSPQPIPEPTPSVDIPTTPMPASPEPGKPSPSKGKAVSTRRSTLTPATRRAVASPAKSRPSLFNSSSARSLVGSPPKASLHSSVSQPLKPQHTGQSVASNPSTTRQARAVPRTAPSTPARPKSAAAHHQPVTRPKTPSSGLFAPTAASLARSRNAPPPPPPPVKKVTLSSDAAERLSKPTAASLSKARAPVSVAVPSPAKLAKSTSTGAHPSTPRGQLRPKAKHAPVKPKEVVDTKEGIMPSVSEPPCDSDHPSADHVENGHEPGAVILSDAGSAEDTHGHPGPVSDAAQDLTAREEAGSDPGIRPEQQGGEHRAEEADSHDQVAEYTPEEAAREHEQAYLGVHKDLAPEPTGSYADEAAGNGDTLKVEHAVTGNDIEDIVNLLEGKPRPQSIVSIPDEDGDIPEY